ncbi:SDR family oxidoreductase [Bradyrhizobium jicamae]|uniref:SDR family oxidoreductase n=1 Tax=Bradyrhizobium jicamae TaxID=280332 RepID=A0ABS5FWI1_9BRAD|nr:SDR family oxidoreductase [Bradyrhizobium jicamae]MBR0801201.1 SDR family oxidoreductase [Bradyrhizobium jicamae]MBR0938480.1 SDR family oxidoreductase [Bradyrhizobium jicamae]
MKDPEASVFEIDGKHVLITGGSSGFGRHFARFLAAKGARVTLAARRAEALASAVTDINGSGGKAQSVVLDVTIAETIDAAFKEAEAQFGPVHAVVNNAGVTATKPALDQDERAWDSVIDTNLKGVWQVAQASARRMIENKVKGSIVNIASILGLRVAGAVAPYAISKAGVVQMTKALALEWARHSIRVNALAPGYFATELNDDFFESNAGQALIKRVPQRRLGQLNELDGPLLLLISDAGSFMTGSVVAVDGGHLVSGL